ncbi:MAG TPA: YdcF family protein, partial [Bacteroidetes bacterium]|nr:YdcF family protein [Bacteroidota bacterium]
LSGNARDRGTEAARLFQAGYAPRIVCLGGERNYFLELFDMLISTAELTKRVVLEQLIPAQSIELLEKGTSTFEEFEAITAMCTARGWKKIMVVSSRFHSR